MNKKKALDSIPAILPSAGRMTPQMVHYGTAEQIRDLRQSVLDKAYIAYPERFVHSAPKALELPTQVWINKPKHSDEHTR